MLSIVCIGAGVMSSAFAVAERTKNKVCIIPAPFDSKIVSRIEFERYDKRLDVSWPDVPFVSQDIKDFDVIVIGVSSLGIPWAKQITKKLLEVKKVPVILLTKGLMDKDGQIMTIPDYLEPSLQTDILSINGPCIAKVLAKQRQSEVVISGRHVQSYQKLIDELTLPFYTFQVTKDYVGAAWAGALKNIYAILIAKESNNLNMRSVAFANSINEIAIWVKEQGGSLDTVYGLAGLGDLYVTSQGGRNGQLGEYLANGLTIDDILSGPMKGVTVEGVDLAMMLINKDYKNKPLFSQMVKLLHVK